MMKFACFEKTVVALYDYVVPKPRDQCSKAEQLVVTFAAGYIAGSYLAPFTLHPPQVSSAPSCPTRPTPWSAT